MSLHHDAPCVTDEVLDAAWTPAYVDIAQLPTVGRDIGNRRLRCGMEESKPLDTILERGSSVICNGKYGLIVHIKKHAITSSSV